MTARASLATERVGRRGQPRNPDGSKAVHTGQLVTRDDVLGHTHELAPTVDKLTVIGEGPLKVGPTGHYTDPQPGKAPDREF